MADTPIQKTRPTQFRWAVFLLTCFASWTLYLHRYTFAFIKPALTEEWGLTKTQLGWLDSAFSVCYAAFQLPLGVAADLVGVHLILTLLIVVWSGGLALHAWAPSVSTLVAARATFGIGQSAAFGNISRVAKSWFPISIRTTLAGTAGVTAGRLGGLSASLLFSTVMLGMLGLDWRTAIYILAAGGGGLGLIFALAFRNSPRRHPLVNEAEADRIEDGDPDLMPGGKPAKPSAARPSTWAFVRSLRGRAIFNMMCLNVQTILSAFADNVYSAWIPLFLFEVHDLKFKEMGIYSALPLLGGAIAGMLGGMLNDACIAVTGNRRWSRTAVGGIGKYLAAVLLLVAMNWYSNPYAFCLFLFAVKFFGDWSLTTTWGVVTDIGGRATSSVFSFNNAVATTGSIGGPIIYGWIAQNYGWPSVFLTAAAAYVLCALSWVLIDSTVPMVADE